MLPPGYRGHSEIAAAIRRLPGAYELGHSVDHIPILAASFGPVTADRVSIVIAGLHAIEWIGVETAVALTERLAKAPPPDRRVIVVALANPDGYRAIETDLWQGRRRFRRTNARGVDLNRNWATDFLPRRKRIAGFNWPGPSPYSEPEVAAIVRMLDREVAAGAQIDTALSLHSFGRKLLVPHGARWRRPLRYRELHERAGHIQARLSERYTISQVSRWVPGAFACGIEIDDLHERYGACALLVECSLGGLSRDPSTWLSPFHWFNPRRPSLVAADIARAIDPFVRGA
ncbi:MAG: Carboxypeptidase [Deltaproteobacteria bacterium]|nr:Carboxypeptidase [Deltaproteobacteria bacterium]